MRYVRDQILSDVALITKRSLFDVSDTDRDAICVSVKQLISMQDHGSVSHHWLMIEYAHLLSFSLGGWCGVGKCTSRSFLEYQDYHHWSQLGVSSQSQGLLRGMFVYRIIRNWS